jgi:hypothetical protein
VSVTGGGSGPSASCTISEYSTKVDKTTLFLYLLKFYLVNISFEFACLKSVLCLDVWDYLWEYLGW